jgi:hypothetical protein
MNGVNVCVGVGVGVKKSQTYSKLITIQFGVTEGVANGVNVGV